MNLNAVGASQAVGPCSTRVQHRHTVECFPRLFHAIRR